MTIVLALLLVNAGLGAWDTLWYHEYRARLADRIEHTATELELHAARDVIYAVVYLGLGWWRPEGWLVAALGAVLVAEIAITLADFVVEDRDRPAIGGISPGERILHTLMAIVYGAMLARLIPELADAWAEPTSLVRHDAPVWMSMAATVVAAGIAVSGVRDAVAVERNGSTGRRHPRSGRARPRPRRGAPTSTSATRRR